MARERENQITPADLREWLLEIRDYRQRQEQEQQQQAASQRGRGRGRGGRGGRGRSRRNGARPYVRPLQEVMFCYSYLYVFIVFWNAPKIDFCNNIASHLNLMKYCSG